MRILGFEITITKAAPLLSPASPGSGGWIPMIREPFTGAWQRNLEVRVDSVLSYPAVFRCISLISGDIAKLRPRLVEQDANGIWTEVDRESPLWPVLRKPNRYQNRIQFVANWVESKLIHGNTYVLKERDNRGGDAREIGVVRRLYVLDPTRVTVLLAPDGSVYYQLRCDHLAGVPDETITLPASEVIHDRWNTIHHPLVGTSPIHAAGVAATQGLKIQESSTAFFAGGAHPSGILIAPTTISKDQADLLHEQWNKAYGPQGTKAGQVAVLGGGMSYTPLTMSATDAQMLEQLKWSAETVCSVFGVPPHMIGIGQPPTYNNIEALNAQYYAQCLQTLIESLELCLDEGLELPKPYGTEFDLDDLLRMDTKTKAEAARQAIQSGVAPNEIRRKYFDLAPVDGGETPYLQEQMWPLRHLSERPLPSRKPTEPAAIEETPGNGESGEAAEDDGGATARALVAELRSWEREASATLAA